MTPPSTQVFECALFGALRTATEGGKILFCLADVARALSLTTTAKLKNRLKGGGVYSIHTVSPTTNQHGKTTEQVQQMTFIDEPNLYRCIFQSRKAEAEKFQAWVFDEVLPAIRKDGGYIATAATDDAQTLMARALRVADETLARYEQRAAMQQDTIDEQERQLKIQAPMVDYVSAVLSSADTYTSTQMAKELGISSANKMHQALKAQGTLFRQSGQWQPTAKIAGKGYTATRTGTFIGSDGQPRKKLSTVWTEKGRAWLHACFGRPTTADLFAKAEQGAAAAKKGGEQ